MGRLTRLVIASIAAVLLPATTAWACGFLVAANGTIRLDTFTAAAILEADGDAHYVTSFSFGGSPESFGAIIPLPDIPYEVEKAPGWFLQRLIRESSPLRDAQFEGATAAAQADGASVIASYEVDSLDIVVLEGGGADVLAWAAENGFDLGVADGDADDLTDAVAMLDFYAERSPIFAAIKFDNERAAEQGVSAGEGTPVRFSFHDQTQAWIPVKVLGFDKPEQELVVADLFLMTPDAPTILGGRVAGTEVTFQQSYGPDSSLVFDLTDDDRADWVPTAFTLTRVNVRTENRLIDWDIAATSTGRPDEAWAFGTAWVAARQGEAHTGNSSFSSDGDIVRAELGEDGGFPVAVALGLAALAGVGIVAMRRLRRPTTVDA